MRLTITKLLAALAVGFALSTNALGDQIDEWVEAYNTGPTPDGVGEFARPIEVVHRTKQGPNYWFELQSARDSNTSGWTHGWIGIEFDSKGETRAVAWTTLPPPPVERRYGQGADIATTAVALAQGATEINPIPVPVLAVAKLGVMPAIASSSLSNCVTWVPPMEIFGWGAAAWNLGVIAGFTTPAGLFAAFATAALAVPSYNDIFWTCAPKELLVQE